MDHAPDDEVAYYEAALRADARRRWILIVAVPVAAVAVVLALPLVLGGVAGRATFGALPFLPAALTLVGGFAAHAALQWRSERRLQAAMPRAQVRRQRSTRATT
jgi:hypothetical protein